MLTLISVFSFVVVGDWFCEGFITVVLLSFFCVGGFTTVVLLSFFSAGGFCDRRFLLFTRYQECQADKQTNIFFHTKESRLGTDLVAFDRIPNLVERRIY